jgi:MarR family transcriptional regulator, organic hydroperoxide resistance regulator
MKGLGVDKMDLKKILNEANQYSEGIKGVFIKEYKRLLDENDLSTKQSLVLSTLDMKKKLTMNEVAEIINATPSAASQFIRKLENSQYVKREVNKDNRREVFVLLDIQGEKFYEELNAIDEMVLEKYFMKLPKADIIKYHEILKKLHGIVTEDEEK